ncbi:MAG TPA: hypothetical protein VF960_12825, partial [Chloroflexota bacterium]
VANLPPRPPQRGTSQKRKRDLTTGQAAENIDPEIALLSPVVRALFPEQAKRQAPRPGKDARGSH